MPSHQYAPSNLRASQLAHTATVKYKHLSFWVENSQSIWLYRGLLAKINSPMGSALRSKSLSSPKICIRKIASASKGIEGVSKHDFLWVSMQFLINALLEYLFPFYNLFHKATFLPFSQFTDVACNVVTFLLIAGAFRDKDVEANFVHVPLIMAISEAALQIKVHSPVMLTCLPYKSSFPKTLPFSNYVLELTGLRDGLSQQKSTTPHIFISPFQAKCSGGLPGAKLRDVSTDEYSLSIFDTLADGEMYFVIKERRGI